MKNASKEVDTFNPSLKMLPHVYQEILNLSTCTLKKVIIKKFISCIRKFIVLSNKCVGVEYWVEWGNTELGKSVIRTFRFMHLTSLNPLDQKSKHRVVVKETLIYRYSPGPHS